MFHAHNPDSLCRAIPWNHSRSTGAQRKAKENSTGLLYVYLLKTFRFIVFMMGDKSGINEVKVGLVAG